MPGFLGQGTEDQRKMSQVIENISGPIDVFIRYQSANPRANNSLFYPLPAAVRHTDLNW